MATTAADLPVHRVDAERYRLIVESGALSDQRVELIDGIITSMSPQSPQHAVIVTRLTRLLGTTSTFVRAQSPLQATTDSVPEPDLAVVAGDDPHAHPTTALLVVEVSSSSHRLDRGRKLELYAAASVPVYWLVDIPARVVEVRADPGVDGYRSLRTYALGESVPSPIAGGEISLSALFEGF